MPYPLDVEIAIDFETDLALAYIISSAHRGNANPNKSRWIISHEDELNCFVQTLLNQWVSDNKAWGLIIEGEKLKLLGYSPDNSELKIAKFVDGNNNKIWHGYPVNYPKSVNDRPTQNILLNWVGNGFISAAKMKRIQRGNLCNL